MMNLQIYIKILPFPSPPFKENLIFCHLKVKSAPVFNDLKVKSALIYRYNLDPNKHKQGNLNYDKAASIKDLRQTK